MIVRMLAAPVALALCLGFLSSCQSAPPPKPDPTEGSSLKAASPGFSPTGEPGTRLMKLDLGFGNREAVNSWKVSIVLGTVLLKEFSGFGPDLPEELTWDGIAENGKSWPEGEYYALLSVDYGTAYNPSTIAWDKFRLVSSAPELALKANPPAFTPAGKAMAEPIRISLGARSALAKVASWDISILDPKGATIRTFEGQGDSAELTWDGSFAGSALVEPSKEYRAVATARDEYGNAAVAALAIPVKGQPNAPEPSSIAASSKGFSPTGEPSSRSLSLLVAGGNRESIKSWSVEIATGAVVVKRFAGVGSNLPPSVTWDGRAEGGALWPEGEYTPILVLDYGTAFNPVRVVGEKFALVASPPALKLAASPPAFTPQGEGMAQPLRISLEGASRFAKPARWSISMLDPRGKAVASFDGLGGSAAAVWDGALAGGGFAEPGSTYTAKARLRDEYGNVGEASLPIPVAELAPAPEASHIATEMRGFSPASGRAKAGLEFSIIAGSSAAMRAWRVDIGGAGGVKRSFRGGPGSLPAALAWDGKDDSGALVPEGAYRAELSVDYGRTYKAATSRTRDFLVSIAPPSASIGLSPEAFTPSDAGVAAPVSIRIEASAGLGAIEEWSLELRDDQGRVVQSFTRAWPTNQVLWDGRTMDGGVVEPGQSYAARASIVDEFGNRGTASASIPVKEIPSPTEPSLVEPRAAGFSAAAGAKQRGMDLFLVAGNLQKLKGWKLAISHSERGTQRSYSGDAASFKKTLTWDGKTGAGALAPDGVYVAVLSLDYGKDFKPGTTRSTPFALQSSPPEAGVSVSPPSLTPKAGAFEGPVEIALSPSSKRAEIESWTVSILDRAGKTVAFFKSAGPEKRALWDGKTSSGAYAEPSTTYSVLAELRDVYGNEGTARAVIPVGDLPPAPGENSIGLSSGGFSPDGDGVMDAIDLRLAVTNKESVNAWKVAILDGGGAAVKTFAGGAAALREVLTWSGRSDSGSPAAEGPYVAELSLDYGSFFKAQSVRSRRFVLDLSPPTGSLAVSPTPLVPDAKGLVVPAAFAIEASSALARIASWSVEIADAAGRRLRSYEGSWPPQAPSWDGTFGGDGLVEPNGTYSATATVVDEFGMSSRFKASLPVGPLPPPTEESSLRARSPGFSAAAKGSIRFDLAFGNRNLVKAWRLDVEREDKTVRMGFRGDPARLPENFAWDGRLQDGTIAPDGRYVAALSVEYGRVYAPARVESAPFSLASTPPPASLSIAPALFSPDGDGVDETATIKLEASSRYAKISDWSVDIFDPAGNPFASFRGPWPMQPLSWNGKNAKGETVESAEDYAVLARVRDEFGNVSESRKNLSVDILLVKTGEGYRIRIASIVFKPFTADYQDVAPEQAAANIETLGRLAEKLKKFPGYQIKLVGHAVMVNWDEPAQGKAEQEKVLLPLSRSRAEAIKQALAVRGIEISRLSSEGVGAADQIVPDSDFANRWKNRRVEFFLQRKK